MNKRVKEIYLRILKGGEHLAVIPGYPNMPSSYVRVGHKYSPVMVAILMPKQTKDYNESA